MQTGLLHLHGFKLGLWSCSEGANHERLRSQLVTVGDLDELSGVRPEGETLLLCFLQKLRVCHRKLVWCPEDDLRMASVVRLGRDRGHPDFLREKPPGAILRNAKTHQKHKLRHRRHGALTSPIILM